METVGYAILALVIYDVVKWVIDLVWDIMTSKPGIPRYENPPPPPPRKSFKERLEEKQALANHHGHQPTDKFKASNPPKETGT